MATVLTLNAFLLDIRLFGLIPVYRAAPHIAPRLVALPDALIGLGADVICLQEVFRRPHRRQIAERLRAHYPECAGLRHLRWPLGTGLMVLSRHPILTARRAEFRAAFPEERLAIRMGLLDCVVRLPDLGPTRIINAHLTAGGLRHHPESPTAEAVRGRQAAELLARAGDGAGPGRVIVAGDMNAGPEASAVIYRAFLDDGFRDAFAEARARDPDAPGPVVTWDPNNPLIMGPLNESLPPQRIDHVFLGGPGAHGLAVRDARVVLHEPRAATAAGQAMPVSDHYGVMVRIEGNREGA